MILLNAMLRDSENLLESSKLYVDYWRDVERYKDNTSPATDVIGHKYDSFPCNICSGQIPPHKVLSNYICGGNHTKDDDDGDDVCPDAENSQIRCEKSLSDFEKLIRSYKPDGSTYFMTPISILLVYYIYKNKFKLDENEMKFLLDPQTIYTHILAGTCGKGGGAAKNPTGGQGETRWGEQSIENACFAISHFKRNNYKIIQKSDKGEFVAAEDDDDDDDGGDDDDGPQQLTATEIRCARSTAKRERKIKRRELFRQIYKNDNKYYRKLMVWLNTAQNIELCGATPCVYANTGIMTNVILDQSRLVDARSLISIKWFNTYMNNFLSYTVFMSTGLYSYQPDCFSLVNDTHILSFLVDNPDCAITLKDIENKKLDLSNQQLTLIRFHINQIMHATNADSLPNSDNQPCFEHSDIISGDDCSLFGTKNSNVGSRVPHKIQTINQSTINTEKVVKYLTENNCEYKKRSAPDALPDPSENKYIRVHDDDDDNAPHLYDTDDDDITPDDSASMCGPSAPRIRPSPVKVHSTEFTTQQVLFNDITHRGITLLKLYELLYPKNQETLYNNTPLDDILRCPFGCRICCLELLPEIRCALRCLKNSIVHEQIICEEVLKNYNNAGRLTLIGPSKTKHVKAIEFAGSYQVAFGYQNAVREASRRHDMLLSAVKKKPKPSDGMTHTPLGRKLFYRGCITTPDIFDWFVDQNKGTTIPNAITDRVSLDGSGLTVGDVLEFFTYSVFSGLKPTLQGRQNRKYNGPKLCSLAERIKALQKEHGRIVTLGLGRSTPNIASPVLDGIITDWYKKFPFMEAIIKRIQTNDSRRQLLTHIFGQTSNMCTLTTKALSTDTDIFRKKHEYCPLPFTLEAHATLRNLKTYGGLTVYDKMPRCIEMHTQAHCMKA